MNKFILFSSILILTILLSFSVDPVFVHAVHFAQTNVEQDGDYEYKFKVLNSDKGETTKIFEGDYSVTILKVVYLNQENLI